MSSAKRREFDCPVVSERVTISLKSKPAGGLRGPERLFVQCNQHECQYVDANRPPCPLNLALFAEEVQAREERARLRRGADRSP